MKKAVIEIDDAQLLNALGQLPQDDLKRLLDKLFLKGIFKKPDFEAVSLKARRLIKKNELTPDAVDEAIAWARR